MSLRLLSTGVARDVSGVLRISKAAGADEIDTQSPFEEKEVLYLVGGDGSVKVFERGTG
jgi:elongator complex protein 6